jgi:hypothetical protein
MIGGRLNTGHQAHRVYQNLPVVWACPADQRPVNIE